MKVFSVHLLSGAKQDLLSLHNYVVLNDSRELISGPYRIIYSVTKSEVFVHCILDGRRDLQDLLEERLLR